MHRESQGDTESKAPTQIESHWETRETPETESQGDPESKKTQLDIVIGRH